MIYKKSTILIYALILIAISFLEMNLWIFMLLAWFGLGFFIIYKKFDLRLADRERKIWFGILYLYPLIETLIKIFIYFNIIPYSYLPLNIAEHFMWAFCMTFYLRPLIINKKVDFGFWTTSLLLIGLVTIIGNLNEFVEYTLRMAMNLTSDYKMALYYTDTMRDELMNLLGATIAVILMKIMN